ncbi:MAG: ABC transporter permease [Clostridiales bacterium]|nr:ABC transporter permease [Clostridiales bacterium]
MNKYEYQFAPDSFELVGDKVDISKDVVAPVVPFWLDVWRRFRKNKGAVIGITVIVLIILMSIFMPILSSYKFDAIDSASANIKPNAQHWFGTDNFGRDLWVRTWTGTRVSLIVSFAAVVIDIVVGMTYGMISGYFGGMVDTIMQRIQEILNSIPTLVILTLLMTVLEPSLFTIIFALMFTEWIGMSRITRAQVLKIKEDEFVLASRTAGASEVFYIFKELRTNIYSQLIVMAMMTIPNAIFYEAYLSFVGLGLTVPNASLGVLINDGFNYFLSYPYMVAIPVVVLALLMLSFNLFGDGLRDALDPTMKEM